MGGCSGHKNACSALKIAVTVGMYNVSPSGNAGEREDRGEGGIGKQGGHGAGGTHRERGAAQPGPTGMGHVIRFTQTKGGECEVNRERRR